MTVWTRQTLLRRAVATDVPAIMEIERQPGYEQLVGRWNEAQHFQNISKPGYLYLVQDGSLGVPIAFAAISGLGHRDGDVLINRMIVRTPGQGIGKPFLHAIMQLAFEGAPTYRIGAARLSQPRLQGRTRSRPQRHAAERQAGRPVVDVDLA